MAYTDDAVKAKLSALNETQESIVTVAQWVMFHRRHANTTASLWLQRLKDSSSNKRLNLIYLTNEVAQQSKARKKDEFLLAFSPVLAEACGIAYKGATNEVQQKLRRVIEVWRARLIFERPIQEAIEARIDELDKSRSSGKKPLGGSLFSSSSGPSAPQELQPLIPLQIALSKAAATTAQAVPSADTEYEKLTDPTKNVPTPPVYAARLSALLKSLASAEGAVSESIKARSSLLEGLEKIVETNRTSLANEETQLSGLMTRKNHIEVKKREVEDGIMRGLSAESSPVAAQGSPFSDPRLNGRTETPMGNNGADPDRPDVEELTPPPEPMKSEEFPGADHMPHTTSDFVQAQATNKHSPSSPQPPPPAPPTAGSDLLSSLNMPPVRQFAASTDRLGAGTLAKKRKLEDESEMFEDAMADLDDDVAELLRAESWGR